MKTLKLNKMEGIQGAGGCDNARLAAEVASALGQDTLAAGIRIGAFLAGC